ncbi:MAG: LCP family protein [Patescibacteria group bacterium]
MDNIHEREKHILDPRINLLNHDDNRYPRGKKVFRVSKFILYLLTVLVIAFFVFSYQVLFTNNSVSDIFSGKINIFKQLNTLALDGSSLKGQSDDRINILLLGMGGAGHEGPYLTDTIILASVQPSTKKIAMISIPRDLHVNISGFGWWKINNANAFGEQKNPGAGGELAKETLEQTLGLPIHYYVRVDFNGFEKTLDDLGGVKIFVEKGFTDYQYPTDDFKFQVVSFEPGWQTMDGDTALKFSRSRHGNNGEGSDFARSKRQQKILQALKSRIFSFNFLLSPGKISKILNEFSNHLRTDMEPWEAVVMAKLVERLDTKQIATLVLEDGPNGLLYSNIVNEAYVLQPKGDDFSQITYLIKNIFNGPQVISEDKTITLELRNGTALSGLASRHAQELKTLGFRVNQIGNAPEQNLLQTQIFKLNSNELKEQTDILEKKYKTIVKTNSIPAWISELSGTDLDFFIVLGADAEKL